MSIAYLIKTTAIHRLHHQCGSYCCYYHSHDRGFEPSWVTVERVVVPSHIQDEDLVRRQQKRSRRPLSRSEWNQQWTTLSWPQLVQCSRRTAQRLENTTTVKWRGCRILGTLDGSEFRRARWGQTQTLDTDAVAGAGRTLNARTRWRRCVGRRRRVLKS